MQQSRCETAPGKANCCWTSPPWNMTCSWTANSRSSGQHQQPVAQLPAHAPYALTAGAMPASAQRNSLAWPPACCQASGCLACLRQLVHRASPLADHRQRVTVPGPHPALQVPLTVPAAAWTWAVLAALRPPPRQLAATSGSMQGVAAWVVHHPCCLHGRVAAPAWVGRLPADASRADRWCPLVCWWWWCCWRCWRCRRCPRTTSSASHGLLFPGGQWAAPRCQEPHCCPQTRRPPGLPRRRRQRRHLALSCGLVGLHSSSAPINCSVGITGAGAASVAPRSEPGLAARPTCFSAGLWRCGRV